jgi:uncharacterized protein YbaP (TraB family)
VPAEETPSKNVIITGINYQNGLSGAYIPMLRIIGKTATVLILCLVLLMSCSTPADDSEDTSLSFLWEVSSDTNTVYILGSVHVAKADIYPLAEAIENAYALSDYLVVEYDTNAVSELEMTALLLEKGMYPTGESLRDNITEDLYSRLCDRLRESDSTGLLLSSVHLFKPWVVANLIADLDYMALGYEVEYGIETYFLDKAEADSKDILELESAEFQLDIFASLSDELQIMMLEDAVNHQVTEESMEMMFEAWSTGDAEMMEQLLFISMALNPEYQPVYDMLYYERNFLMLNKIEQYLQDDKTYFVVVGAAHLVGENGLINLLDSKGYTVEQQ